MYFYHIEILVKQSKSDEFMESIRSLSADIQKDKHCYELNLYKDLQHENIYSIIAEWETNEAMNNHFKSSNFSILVGSARVLGEKFEIEIGESITDKGGLLLAKEKIYTGQERQT